MHVWSKVKGDLELLKVTFGGNFYRHGSGMVWICGNKKDLRKVLAYVDDHDLTLNGYGILKEALNAKPVQNKS